MFQSISSFSLLCHLLKSDFSECWIHFCRAHPFAESDTHSQYSRRCVGVAAKHRIKQQITHCTQRVSKRSRSVGLKVDKSVGYYTSLPPASSDLSNREADTCGLTYMHQERGSRPRIPRMAHKCSIVAKRDFPAVSLPSIGRLIE